MLLQCIGVFNLMVEKCEKEPMVYYMCKLCVDGRYINRHTRTLKIYFMFFNYFGGCRLTTLGKY